MDVSAREVWGGLRQRYGGHIMCLEFIPMRNIIQQCRLQLNQDLSEGTGMDESNKGVVWKRLEVSSKCHRVPPHPPPSAEVNIHHYHKMLQ